MEEFFPWIGWYLGGLTLGLWLGERGRRKDLQWIAEAAIGPRKLAARASTPEVDNSAALQDGSELEEFQLDEITDRIKQAAVDAGVEVTDEEARTEARSLIERGERYTGADI